MRCFSNEKRIFTFTAHLRRGLFFDEVSMIYLLIALISLAIPCRFFVKSIRIQALKILYHRQKRWIIGRNARA